MKKFLRLTRLFVCLCAMLSSTSAFAGADWIGLSYIYVNGTWYQGSGGSADWASGGAFNSHDFGFVSNSLTIAGQIQIHDANGDKNWGGNGDWMHYTIDKNDEAWVNLNMSKSGESGNNMVFQTGGSSFATATIDISELPAGEHTLSVWFGNVDNHSDNNGGNNYVATFVKAPFNVSGVTVENVSNTDWTGSVIHPVPVVKRGETTLTSGVDYSVSYSDGCVEVGEYTVTIMGTGNYAGTKDVNFSIQLPNDFYLVRGAENFNLYTTNLLSDNPDNSAEKMIRNVVLGANEGIKVVYTSDHGATRTWYPDGENNNYIPGKGTWDIYFRSDYKGGSSWHHGTLFASAQSSIDVALAPTGYGTYYNSTCEVTLPTGVVAYVLNNATPTYEKVADGDGDGETVKKTVPAGVAVLLYSASKPAKVTLNLNTATSDSRTFASNKLHGSDVATTTTGGAKYYKLTYSDNDDNFGWYWGAANGAAFTSPAHKAWLALSSNTARAFLTLPGDDFTGISTIENRQQNVDNAWYDLNGRRIKAPTTKGIYVKDGRKLVIK